ncbi:MAG: tryptophan-rich sensory protein [Candidatus Eisenbacteria bacterium]|nr:tryptophan-rich sensory protein [Candidatus Eisenbacteria bacterium]
MKTTVLALLGWLALSFAAGFVGSRFTPSEWYQQLAKPSWTPPGAVFAPVWSVLYIMMGVAAWLVWRNGEFSRVATPLTLFIVQLVLNALWSYFFFGLQKPGLAFLDIVVLWVLIVLTLITFWRVSAAAGVLFIPYLAWVTFASFLNFAVWRMNTGR